MPSARNLHIIYVCISIHMHKDTTRTHTHTHIHTSYIAAIVPVICTHRIISEITNAHDKAMKNQLTIF